MTSPTLAFAPEFFAAAFGAVAALLLIGGPVILAWQRNRQQFELMRAALDKGMTRFPQGPPLWLLSLRQGLMITALGAGLLLVGSLAWALALQVPAPEFPKTSGPGRPAAATPAPLRDDRGPTEPFDRPFPPPPGQGRPDDRGPGMGGPHGMDGRGGPPGMGGPGRGQGGPPGMGPGMGGPRGPGGGPGGAGPMPPLNPTWQRWHHAQLQAAVGQIAVASGLIITLLGLVRAGFARVERRVLLQQSDPASSAGDAPPPP